MTMSLLSVVKKTASFNDDTILFDCAYPMMTKKEAREFARQLLEMCGGE